MSPQLATKSPASQERSQRTEEKLLDALEQFLREGTRFEDINVRDIAESAGCTTGAVYNRFENKNGLLMRLYATRVIPRELAEMARVLDADFCQNKGIREIIRGALEQNFKNYREYGAITLAAYNIMNHEVVPPDVVQARRDFSNRTTDYLLARLFERRDKIGHPDFRTAADVGISSASYYIQDIALHSGTDLDITTMKSEDHVLLDYLADMVIGLLNVDEPQITMEAGWNS